MRTPQALLLGIVLLASACTKNDPEASLPRISQDGLNTGGFLADGVAYPATGWSGALLSTFNTGAAALEGGYDTFAIPGYPLRPEYELLINSEQGNKRVTVRLYLRQPAVGSFALNHNTKLPPSAPDSAVFDHATIDFHTGELYTTSARHTGSITMSRANRAAVSAGTFEFTAVSTRDPNKTIRVTAGRFDRGQ